MHAPPRRRCTRAGEPSSQQRYSRVESTSSREIHPILLAIFAPNSAHGPDRTFIYKAALPTWHRWCHVFEHPGTRKAARRAACAGPRELARLRSFVVGRGDALTAEATAAVVPSAVPAALVGTVVFACRRFRVSTVSTTTSAPAHGCTKCNMRKLAFFRASSK